MNPKKTAGLVTTLAFLAMVLGALATLLNGGNPVAGVPAPTPAPTPALPGSLIQQESLANDTGEIVLP